MGDPSSNNPSPELKLAAGQDKELTVDEAEAFARQFKAIWEKSNPKAAADPSAKERRPPQEQYFAPRPQDITPRGIGPVGPPSLRSPSSGPNPAPVGVTAPARNPDAPPSRAGEVTHVAAQAPSARPAPKHTLLGIAPVRPPSVAPPGSGAPPVPAAQVEAPTAEAPLPSNLELPSPGPVFQLPSPANAEPDSLPSIVIQPDLPSSSPSSTAGAPAFAPLSVPQPAFAPPSVPQPAHQLKPGAAHAQLSSAAAVANDAVPDFRGLSNRKFVWLGLAGIALLVVGLLLFGGASETENTQSEPPVASPPDTAVARPAVEPRESPPEPTSTAERPSDVASKNEPPPAAPVESSEEPPAPKAPRAASPPVSRPIQAVAPAKRAPSAAKPRAAKPTPAKPAAPAPSSKNPAIVRDNPF